ncbi:hypothetical protein L1987_00993 [Smallanthus sonchifolius]|uniref:Uncharacterized protein n=1 Tax=Smallanthus sonchifolius TaxID=185202 RepID=A0ACB9K3S4_9ASTR|nr:hypothetical protein L1987_00993 [Smallanthus sonchifolius]
MNMCSKCHKDMEFAISVINIFNGTLPDSPESEVALLTKPSSAPAESSDKPNPDAIAKANPVVKAEKLDKI